MQDFDIIEYMELDYLNAKGWLTNAERQFLFDRAKALSPDAIIVNVGVEYGASIVCLLAGNPTATVVGIDLDISKYEGPRPRNLVLLQGDSFYYSRNWPFEKFDFIFVDGDHSYESVLKDCEFSYLVAKWGTMAFHDCYAWPPDPPKSVHHSVPGVDLAVSEYFKTRRISWKEGEAVDSIRWFTKRRKKTDRTD